jgi:S-formylglutathione hydrolase FrmB
MKVATGVLFLSCAEPTTGAREGTSGNQPSIEWVSPVIQAPGLEFRIFHSDLVQAGVSYHIYLPEQYDSDETRHFPVLYWLHGGGGGPGQEHLAGGGNSPAVLSGHFGDAIRSGKIPPLLLVFPNGLRGGMWCDSKDGTTPIESILITELIPDVDSHFRTVRSREGRMIEGHSMGGYGAARLGFSYPKVFSAISLQAAGPLQQVFSPEVGPAQNAAARARLLEIVYGDDQEYFRRLSPWFLAERNADLLREGMRIRQLIGDLDFTLPANQEFHAHLSGLDIPHMFRVLPGVEHSGGQYLDVLRDDEDYWEYYRPLTP